MSKKRTDAINLEIKEVSKVSVTGFIVNIFLSLLKAGASIFTGSYSLGADAVHSLSDSLTDILLIAGVRFWSKPPDEDHPYGHKRIETILTLSIGAFLIVAGVTISWNSILNIKNKNHIVDPDIAIIVAFLSIVVKEILYRWTISKGKKLGSTSVIANAWHHRSDGISSIPVFITLVVTKFYSKLLYLDAVCAFLVSIFILHGAWKIIFPALSQLIDHGASAEELNIIEKIAKSVEGVRDIHAIRTRYQGAWISVDLHVLVDKNITVEEGHIIAGKTKATLMKNGPKIIDVLIHIEPYNP